MKHGEIWWAELDPPAGRRPVLLLSRDEAYAIRKLIIVVLVTSKIRHLMTEVILGTGEGLPRPCVINLDMINTISKSRLIERITTLSPEKLRAVEAALHFALGLES